MPFVDHIGPDAASLESAWGSAASPSRRGKAAKGQRAQPRARTMQPKIATTHKKHGHVRSSYRVTSPATAEEAKKAAVAAKRRAGRPESRRDPRKQTRLASSTAKPKERPQTAPPKANAWGSKKTQTAVLTTPFKNFYDRGDIPVCIGHGAKRRLQWKCVIDELDYHHYLPIFFEGLRETEEPYSFIAHTGVTNMLEQGGEKVLPVIPQLIMPIKKALNTKNRKTICRVLQVLQLLVKSAPYVGEALVPYYRQILPVFNLVLVLDKRSNFGDAIDYGQQKRENIIDLVNETLEVLEQTGGRDAYVNVKYLVPQFESSFQASA